MQLKTEQKLLLVIIAPFCLGGLIGVYYMLVGEMGTITGSILATIETVAAIFVIALAADKLCQRHSWHPFGQLSFAVLVPTLIATLLSIWQDTSSYSYFYQNTLECTLFISWATAVALSLIGLHSLARLRRQWEWVGRYTVYCIVVFWSTFVLVVILGISDEQWWRLMGVTAILALCGTLAVPILHRVSSIPLVREIHTAELALSVSCPRCRKTEKLPVGRSQCSHCGLRFMIQIEEEACRKCGYPLYQIESAVCPECGTPIARETAAAPATDAQDLNHARS